MWSWVCLFSVEFGFSECKLVNMEIIWKIATVLIYILHSATYTGILINIYKLDNVTDTVVNFKSYIYSNALYTFLKIKFHIFWKWIEMWKVVSNSFYTSSTSDLRLLLCIERSCFSLTVTLSHFLFGFDIGLPEKKVFIGWQ